MGAESQVAYFNNVLTALHCLVLSVIDSGFSGVTVAEMFATVPYTNLCICKYMSICIYYSLSDKLSGGCAVYYTVLTWSAVNTSR